MPMWEGRMAPKAVDARKRFNRNRRFRGHGPLLQDHGPRPQRHCPHRDPRTMRFQVKAMKAGEGVVSLALDARDARDARTQAMDKGYAVLGVTGGAWSLTMPRRRQRFPLLLFTQELLALLNAGISLVEALETLSEKESPWREPLGAGSACSTRSTRGRSRSPPRCRRTRRYLPRSLRGHRAGERAHGRSLRGDRRATWSTRPRLDLVRKKLVSASIYPGDPR